MSAAEKQEESKVRIIWDTSEIYSREVEYMQSQEYADEQGLDEPLSESEAEERMYNDPFAYEAEWDYITDYLAELMKEMNPDERTWRCEVEGFGWRKLNGWKEFDTMDPQKFLQEILPDTQCTFHIFTPDDAQRGGKMFYIRNWHHDAPTGESYYVWVKPEGEEDEEE